MKRLFFLQKKNEALIKNLGKKDVIIYLDNLSSEENQKKHHTIGYYIKKLEDKTIQFRYCYEMRWAQAWAFKKRNKNDNKSFAQELVFQGKSLWYPMEFILHYDVDYLSHECPLSKILLYIDCINMIIKEKKPSQVVIENEKTSFNRVVAKICRKERIRITNLKLKAQKKSFLFRIVNNPLLIRNYVKSRILIRVLVAKVFCKQTKPEKILISTSDRLSYKENRNDVFWGPIIKVMEKQSIPYKMVEYDRIETLDGFKNLKERYMPQKYDAQFIGTYYTLNTLKDIKTMVGFLKKKFKEMDKKGFKESFEYQGVSFYDLIRSRLKKIFLTYAWYIADVYAITKAVIEKEKPQVVLVDHEKNYYGRALISEANFRNIPSLCFEGVQIFDNYMYLTQIPIKEILNKKSIKCYTIYGEIPVDLTREDSEEIIDELKTRESRINKFNKSDEPCVLIANPFALAESVSLHHACHHAIYVDRNFNCGRYLQSLDRIHRVGGSETHQANYYFLQYANAIDNDIKGNLERKAQKMYDLIEEDYSVYSMDMFAEDDEVEAYERLFGKQ